jgi:NADPH:quinone reductase
VKTILIRRTGGAEVLELAEVQDPVPRPDEVTVRAHSMGVGWPDILIRRGVYTWMPTLPVSPGSEMAGTVETVGQNVSGLRAGQKVLVSARELPQRGGCYSELMAVPARALYVLPEHLDLERAVSLPNFQVAYALLHFLPHVSETRRIFVTGVAGAIGTALTQLAKRAGMKVLGSVSSEAKATFARRQGADHTIDYRRENVVERVLSLTNGGGVDLVFDHIGGNQFTENLDMLARWGCLISFNAFTGGPENDLFLEMRRRLSKSISVRMFSMHSFDGESTARREIMSALIKALARGEIDPPTAARFRLEDAAKAQRMVEEGSALGKVILKGS